MATIGYRKVSAPGASVGQIRAMVVPTGPASTSYTKTQVYGDWPDPLSLTPDGTKVVWSMYLTDDDTGLVATGRAYLGWAGNGLTKRMKLAIYTTGGVLVGSSAEVVEPDGVNNGKWVDFTFSPAVSLTYGTAYLIAVWGKGGPYGHYDWLASYDEDYWDPMPPAPGPSGSAGGPLFTGGGML